MPLELLDDLGFITWGEGRCGKDSRELGIFFEDFGKGGKGLGDRF